MRIASVELVGVNVTPKTNWSFLLTRTADGRVGLGECTLANQDAALAAEAARLAALVTGADARARTKLARLLPHAPGGLVAQTVLSAFEQSLWDLTGQETGQPIHALLGGALRDPVPLYANINRGAERTPAGFAAAARRALAAGFTSFKLAPFDPLVWEDGANASAYAEGLARIGAVREAIGHQAELMVDAHWRFSPGGAARLIADVAEFALHWLECPIAEANHAEICRLRGLANARGMRLAGAETLSGLAAYRAILEAGCYDVWMPDIKHCGGHEEMRRIAALALTGGIEIAPHNPTGPAAHAQSLHVSASLANATRLEVQFGETERFFTLLSGASLRFAGGMGTLPAAPGLGCVLDEDAARLTPAQPMPRPWLDPRLG
jgi:galactonate dehydratase